MNLAWGDEKTQSFTTNIGLITSNGPHGHNIMACEWTHYVSYAPALIVLAIRTHKATYKNIIASKEFGINIAAEEHSNISPVAGNNSGHDVDKIKVLEELGVNFYKAKKIDVLMIQGASMNAECKLIKTVDVGDHPLLIGEIVNISHEIKSPLLYHQTKYFKVGERIPKPPQEYLDKIKTLVEKYKR
ncbi:MAG: flavin reductase family protein [bacterium]|nr:flavin reductase family protein [bacterium]